MNYEEMSDFEINLAVAKVKYNHPSDPEYFKFYRLNNGSIVQVNAYKMWPQDLDFCNNPSDAWPIIIENNISISPRNGKASLVGAYGACPHECEKGKELRTSMICFLEMKDSES